MTGRLDETIAALSTPTGESGIAVLRMSGSRALSILDAIFVAGGKHVWEHRRLYRGRLVDGAGDTVDDVMCAVMRGPESYTGEDTVEISCHGNALVVRRVLNLMFANGARSAEPGEFTKRAFMNGKIDLIQAEAVADLIHAKSELQRQVAQRQLSGGLSEKIGSLAQELLELLGIIEANIDFIEDGIDTLDVPGSLSMLDRHARELGELLKSAAFSKPFRDGYDVVIAGQVNAGKSSLFNRLIGENRAIVTDIPGTTRDVLREPIVLEGVVFMLQDTAGLRGTSDRVERIGVDLAEAALDKADMVMFVIDSSEALPEELAVRLRTLPPSRTVVVLNKTDLKTRIDEGRLKRDFPGLKIVHSSAPSGDGLDELKKTLIEYVGREQLDWIARERVVLNARLADILERARARIGVLRDNLSRRAPLEILALDARDGLQLYETATGKRYTDDLLDTIFSRFCIGK